MPDDSIMDWVNNEEGLHNEKLRLFDSWMEEGDAWSERSARRDALAIARGFAEVIQSMPGVRGRYTGKDIKDAADEMLEEFGEHREEAIKAAVERARMPAAPSEPMTPEEAEFAHRCEGIARGIGIGLLRELVPASPERVRKALEKGDKHLNTLPLRKWDQAAAGVPYLPGRGLSLSDKVCALKHVAKWHYV